MNVFIRNTAENGRITGIIAGACPDGCHLEGISLVESIATGMTMNFKMKRRSSNHRTRSD